MKYKYLLILFVHIVLLSACTKNVKDEVPEAGMEQGMESTDMTQDNQDTVVMVGEGMPDDSVDTLGLDGDGSLPDGNPIMDLNNPDSILSQRIVYFEFDSSRVSEEARIVIDAHAQYLASHPEVQIVLEGHCDERGTRDYNLALGEKRAKAVAELISLQGGASSQIQVNSYGEERPVALGHDEQSWQANRRVEILYQAY